MKNFLLPKFFTYLLLGNTFSASVFAEVLYPGGNAGKANITAQSQQKITISNQFIKALVVTQPFSLFEIKNNQNKVIMQNAGPLFTIKLKNGEKITSNDMSLSQNATIINLPANKKALKLSERTAGKMIEANFVSKDGKLKVKSQIILRDNSHYLRQVLFITANEDIEMQKITALQGEILGDAQVLGNTRGSPIVSDGIFAALETPMAINSIENSNNNFNPNAWTKDSWKDSESAQIPAQFSQKYPGNIVEMSGKVEMTQGEYQLTFNYQTGANRINLLGIQILDGNKIISEDWHEGFSGHAKKQNTYKVIIPQNGQFTVKYFAEVKNEPLTSSGEIKSSKEILKIKNQNLVNKFTKISGNWSRKTTLKKDEVWQISMVIGLLEPGQERRSFLAYSERERVVPWRPFVHYNSWYELNINRNDFKDPQRRMSEKQCINVVTEWKEKLYDKRGTYIDAFVWDDGWDEFNSLWKFHIGFPEGFKNIDRIARQQKAGIGAWLGPVGGYGGSKQARLANWNAHHPNNKIGNFQLSNQEYFNAFVGRCSQMINDYDMRYFKFDGISTHFHAKGPGNEEDAEGILRVVKTLREKRNDIFINCTVGTWASPFWFQFVDSVWRQENDHGGIGEGNGRERWITYRDRLVHEVFVKGSPLCPINSLMTHGLMVTKFGPPNSMPKELEGIKKEMRCAFACGSALQELYVDRDLMNTIGGNEILWDELAKCIKWFRQNADVLDDTHWVGGNPWDGKNGAIYGWASWNPNKCTLTLRNSSKNPQKLTITLRKALDVPAKIKGKILLTNAFEDQPNLQGFSNTAIDLDQEVTFELQPFEVYVFNGIPK